jgi:hypothetical protein
VSIQSLDCSEFLSFCLFVLVAYCPRHNIITLLWHAEFAYARTSDHLLYLNGFLDFHRSLLRILYGSIERLCVCVCVRERERERERERDRWLCVRQEEKKKKKKKKRYRRLHVHNSTPTYCEQLHVGEPAYTFHRTDKVLRLDQQKSVSSLWYYPVFLMVSNVIEREFTLFFLFDGFDGKALLFETRINASIYWYWIPNGNLIIVILQ